MMRRQLRMRSAALSAWETRKVLGLVLLVVGAVLLYFGFQADGRAARVRRAKR